MMILVSFTEPLISISFFVHRFFSSSFYIQFSVCGKRNQKFNEIQRTEINTKETGYKKKEKEEKNNEQKNNLLKNYSRSIFYVSKWFFNLNGIFVFVIDVSYDFFFSLFFSVVADSILDALIYFCFDNSHQ